ncbi:MAG: hypothetical protein ACTJHU_00205 [Mycetocola sp.]
MSWSVPVTVVLNCDPGDPLAFSLRDLPDHRVHVIAGAQTRLRLTRAGEQPEVQPGDLTIRVSDVLTLERVDVDQQDAAAVTDAPDTTAHPADAAGTAAQGRGQRDAEPDDDSDETIFYRRGHSAAAPVTPPSGTVDAADSTDPGARGTTATPTYTDSSADDSGTDHTVVTRRPHAAPTFSLRVTDDSGQRLVPLLGAIVVGRAPEPSAGFSRGHSELPGTLTIAAGRSSISQSHVRVIPIAGAVLVRDLWSTNGTRVATPGMAPFRLRNGEEIPVAPGGVVDLGDGVTLTIVSGVPHGA